MHPGLDIVRGAIDADTATRALAAVVRAGVYAAARDSSPWTAPTALRGGLLANFDAMISLRQQSPPSATLVAEVSGEEEIVNTSWNDRKDNRYAIEEAIWLRWAGRCFQAIPQNIGPIGKLGFF